MNTNWSKVSLCSETTKAVKDLPRGYTIWARMSDGLRIFTCLPCGTKPTGEFTQPGEFDGGYFSIAAALKAKFGQTYHAVFEQDEFMERA